MELSIVTTLYKSEQHISEFYKRITRTATQLTDAYEIIFVHDASPDSSLHIARGIAQNDTHVCVINMEQHVGQHKALYAGIQRAHGNRVFLIDSDLEERPELLQAYANAMDASGADIVYGTQTKRQRSVLYRCFAFGVDTIFWLLFPYPPPRNHVMARLMSRRFVDAMLAIPTNTPVVSALCARVPYPSVKITVRKPHERETTYTWRRYCLLIRDIILCSDAAIVRMVLFPIRRLSPTQQV